MLAEVGDEDVRLHSVVRVADEVVVDLMGRACDVGYEEAARDLELIERQGVSIPVASPHTRTRRQGLSPAPLSDVSSGS
jgi:hypothetical protein